MKKRAIKFLSILLSVLILTCAVAGISASARTVICEIKTGGVTYWFEQGEEFVYRAELYAPEKIENGQFIVDYPEYLSIEKIDFNSKLTDVVVNSNPDNESTEAFSKAVHFNFTSKDGFDFAKKSMLVEIKFNMTKSTAGSVAINRDEDKISVCNMNDEEISDEITIDETFTGISVGKKAEKEFKPDTKDGNVAKFGFDSEVDYGGMRILGVQKKADGSSSIRFVAVASCDILSDSDVIDYGFILTTSDDTTENAKLNTDTLTVDNGHKFSCKGTVNSISEGYGNIDWTTTKYKYVTFAVNNITSDKAIVARFYAQTADGYTYGKYYNQYKAWYNGLAVRFSELTD